MTFEKGYDFLLNFKRPLDIKLSLTTFFIGGQFYFVAS